VLLFGAGKSHEPSVIPSPIIFSASDTGIVSFAPSSSCYIRHGETSIADDTSFDHVTRLHQSSSRTATPLGVLKDWNGLHCASGGHGTLCSSMSNPLVFACLQVLLFGAGKSHEPSVIPSPIIFSASDTGIVSFAPSSSCYIRHGETSIADDTSFDHVTRLHQSSSRTATPLGVLKDWNGLHCASGGHGTLCGSMSNPLVFACLQVLLFGAGKSHEPSVIPLPIIFSASDTGIVSFAPSSSCYIRHGETSIADDTSFDHVTRLHQSSSRTATPLGVLKDWNGLHCASGGHGTLCGSMSNPLVFACLQSVFTRDDGILPNFYVPCGIPAITDVTVNQQGLFNLLLNLDAKKSSGPDEIPNIFLKRYAEWCSHYLVIIFKLTLDKGTIPRDWKCGKIIPVHKKGDKTILSNYRPISLTSTCCKTLEHILSKHLITFIESNKLLGSNQYGFRRGCSTTTQLIEIFHDLSITADKGGQTDIIFLDFAKAFDRVSHPKLLYKLSHVLKNDQIVDWLNSYLSGREQYVYFKKERTESLQVISGVPQGSVLGPLLFILFISDMGKDFDSAVTLKHFADDTVIYSNISSNEDQLNLDKHLRKIMKWCADWQMELNISETVYMNVTRKKQHLQFNYSINGLPLVKVNEYKYLGVHLRSDLSWNSHIDYVCKKAFQKLWMLKTKLEFASSDVKLIAFKCLILPTLEYASPVWEPFTNQNIYKLERIQDKAARFIFNCYRSTESVTKLKEQAGLPSIKTRLETNRMKLFFQIFHGHSMLDTQKYVVMSPPVYHRIKHSLNIQSYQYSTDHFKYSFFVRCIDFWNKLPECIVNSQSVSTFVKEIEMFLSSHVTKGCD
ncbi:uncharacterized protein ISCGN_026849, partial [Ixodes scapularis]